MRRGVKSTKCQYPAIKFAFMVGKGKLCQRGAARIGRWQDGCISSVQSFWIAILAEALFASIASNRCPSPRKRILLERQLLIPAYVSLITGERAFIERLDNSKRTSRMDSFGGGYVISPINRGKQSVVKHMLAIDWKFWKSYLLPSCAKSITI